MERRREVKKKRKQKNCTFPNCPKDTLGATDFCSAHGGGKRCTFLNCPSSTLEASNFCKAHYYF